MTTEKQATCAERIEAQWNERAEDLRAMISASDAFSDEDVTAEKRSAWESLGIEGDTPDEISESAYDAMNNLPLSVEVVRTVRVLLSTGGPEDAIEYTLDRSGGVVRAEYVFKDWFDGARMPIEGADLDVAIRYFGAIIPDADTLT